MRHTEFPGDHVVSDVSLGVVHRRLNISYRADMGADMGADLISRKRAVSKMRTACSWLGLVESIYRSSEGGSHLKMTF